MVGGFKESPLKLNAGLGQLEKWDEEKIQSRGAKLAELALNVWVHPQLPEGVLAKYKPSTDEVNYSVEDHPYLRSGQTKNLFDGFRKEVLSLDACVTEEFMKRYVAYKAETNFVDVVPQSRRLRLSLNMPFAEVNDPKGICKDVSDVGHWGNGDVEVALDSLDDLPYVMGLIRQSFDRQMGNTDPP
jgi:predicted transport protein